MVTVTPRVARRERAAERALVQLPGLTTSAAVIGLHSSPDNTPRASPRQTLPAGDDAIDTLLRSSAVYGLHYKASPRAAPEFDFTAAYPSTARAVIRRQQLADQVFRKMTDHNLTDMMMENEAFDSIYSDRHAHKDTETAIGPDLVPRIDPRMKHVRPKDLGYGVIHTVQTMVGERPLLPCRSFMLPNGESGARSHDF